MGTVRHLSVRSIEEILTLLDIVSSEPLLNETRSAIDDVRIAKREGWSMEPELLEVLYCYVRTVRPHTIIEIGTHKGVSASVLAQALKANDYGHLYGIDVNHGGQLGHARRRFHRLQINDRITVIKKDSRSAFEAWGRAAVDLLIIDGSHSFADACIDFGLWSRYVLPQGLIVMHDTVTRLMRRFPEDYIHPLNAYNVLNICNVHRRPSNHEWEGCAFISYAEGPCGDSVPDA